MICVLIYSLIHFVSFYDLYDNKIIILCRLKFESDFWIERKQTQMRLQTMTMQFLKLRFDTKKFLIEFKCILLFSCFCHFIGGVSFLLLLKVEYDLVRITSKLLLFDNHKECKNNKLKTRFNYVKHFEELNKLCRRESFAKDSKLIYFRS